MRTGILTAHRKHRKQNGALGLIPLNALVLTGLATRSAVSSGDHPPARERKWYPNLVNSREFSSYFARISHNGGKATAKSLTRKNKRTITLKASKAAARAQRAAKQS